MILSYQKTKNVSSRHFYSPIHLILRRIRKICAVFCDSNNGMRVGIFCMRILILKLSNGISGQLNKIAGTE